MFLRLPDGQYWFPDGKTPMTISRDPQPQPQQTNWLLWLVIAYLAYQVMSGGGVGGSSPTKIIPSEPMALTVYDNDPAAKETLLNDHPGVADVIDSTADGSIQMWFRKEKSGKWLKYGIAEPAPDPKIAGNDWAVEAYQVWVDAGKKVPYTVASGPTGRGYSGPTPDGQEAASKALKITSK